MELQLAIERLNLQPLPPNHQIFNTKQARGNGVGCFATINIYQGTCILSEGALFSVRKPARTTTIEGRLRLLTPQQRRDFEGLHCSDTQGNITNYKIFDTNNLEMGEEVGIFLQTSRFNHSRVPNAHLSWNQTLQQATIYAIADIPNNVEITVSYNNESQSYMPYSSRWNVLGFNCNCRACRFGTVFGQDSNLRRMHMQSLDGTLEALSNLNGAALQHTNYYATARAMREKLDLEGLIYPDVANVYMHCSNCFNEKRKATARSVRCRRGFAEDARWKALRYARKTLDNHIVATGTQSEATVRTLDWIRDLR